MPPFTEDRYGRFYYADDTHIYFAMPPGGQRLKKSFPSTVFHGTKKHILHFLSSLLHVSELDYGDVLFSGLTNGSITHSELAQKYSRKISSKE